ncbi:PILR alpha-associated neural protein isoform X2 [Clupea harengus]|uniref:PILR alpha-associated neural protein isoform X2 n=1 Tax=Clupea harengus TaxID=7950 RepID=A0A6P8G8Y3_CLUHA|nr:PILR alpha-associated neural protein isoform X2 [Clupea harengus]XP_042565085.1 PILR alpha-associated neural protein isoform X2 [Clupea harengus]
MERCSIPTATSLYCLLLVALVTCPTRCDPNEQNWEELNEMQVEALSAQLSVTAQATPTPLWAVDWGPTQTLEDETQHFLPSQEGDHWQASTDETLPHHKNTLTTHTQQQLPSLEAKDVVTGKDSKTEAEEEFEEVDPQFYVTVTISSVLILAAVIITAKLCYDRSCSRHPPPLSLGGAPPLSLAIPRSLAQEDSRQTLHSTPSFSDRERIPVVNL